MFIELAFTFDYWVSCSVFTVICSYFSWRIIQYSCSPEFYIGFPLLGFSSGLRLTNRIPFARYRKKSVCNDRNTFKDGLLMLEEIMEIFGRWHYLFGQDTLYRDIKLAMVVSCNPNEVQNAHIYIWNISLVSENSC